MASSRLAIDMEADSLYHYFEKVCLIQISTDSNTYILDPLAIRNVNELAPLMCNPSVEKVFHAAGYDTYCLRRDYDFAFANIFDTHLAAQLLGYEFLGLSTLMEDVPGSASFQAKTARRLVAEAVGLGAAELCGHGHASPASVERRAGSGAATERASWLGAGGV